MWNEYKPYFFQFTVTITFTQGSSSAGKRTDLRVVQGNSHTRAMRLIAYTPAGQEFIDDYLYGHNSIPAQCADAVITEAGWQQLSIA